MSVHKSAQSNKADTNDIDDTMLICNVIFKNGRPIIIKALSDYPHPGNPLLKAIDLTNLIAQETNKAVVAELNRLHRYDGKDYDTELDEIIDNRIEELTADKEQTP